MGAKVRWLVVFAVLLAGALLAAVSLGAVWLRPIEVVRALTSGDPSAMDPLARVIVLELRLPRAFLAAFVGAGLAAAGAAYQGLFRNPLAEPFIIGTSSGAALGATVVIVSGWEAPLGFLAPVPLGAFAGAVAAAVLTYLLTAGLGAGSAVDLLLTGVAVGTLLNAGVWVLMTLHDENLARIVAWLMGSLAGRGWPDLGRAWPGLVAGVAGVWALSRPLDALAEGEETARGLGLPIRLATGLIVALASLAAAAAVAAAGIVGFVGLIAPHLARRLVGELHAWLIPASALLGAGLLVLADTAARTLTAPVELPVGVVTAALGGPFFLVLLRGRRTWHG